MRGLEGGQQPRAEACRRFGESVKALWLRVNPDLTLREIAEAAQTGPTTVSDVMAGRRFPKKELAQRIVAGFDGDFTDISELWDELNALQHGAVKSTSKVITRFRNNSEFYGAARGSILASTDAIRVTYARQYPPSEVSTSEAREYFAAMLDWADQPGDRSVTRIFGVPVESPAARRRVTDYLIQHRAEIERRELWNYQAHVFEYAARADLLNMALFDDDVAYVAVSGNHPQKLSGVRVIDSDYATLLVTHFEQLLNGCKSLTDYIDDLEADR
jgi:transcriptional regulator with XRE-family HTH domain